MNDANKTEQVWPAALAKGDRFRTSNEDEWHTVTGDVFTLPGNLGVKGESATPLGPPSITKSRPEIFAAVPVEGGKTLHLLASAQVARCIKQ